jgi:hypothetical protein
MPFSWAWFTNQGGWFGGGGAPSPPPPPPPPPAKSDADIQAEGARIREQQRNKRGRAATILTQQRPGADLTTAPTTAPTLLGGGR